MTFLKSKLSVVVGVLVIVALAVFFYRFSSPVLEQPDTRSTPEAQNIPDLPIAREVSTIASYETPGGTDKVRFTFTLDNEGAIVAVKSSDALKGDEVSENLEKFSQGLLLVVSGKKLSELKPVDRIGKSSLTTAAFNSALPNLQRQL